MKMDTHRGRVITLGWLISLASVAILSGCGGVDDGWDTDHPGKAEQEQKDRWGGYQHQYANGQLTEGSYVDAKAALRGNGRQLFLVDLPEVSEGPVNFWITKEDAAKFRLDGKYSMGVRLVEEQEQALDAELMHFYLGPDGEQQSLKARTTLTSFYSGFDNDFYSSHLPGDWVASDLPEQMTEPGGVWGPWKIFVLRDDHSSADIGGILLNFPCDDGCPEDIDFKEYLDILKQAGAFSKIKSKG